MSAPAYPAREEVNRPYGTDADGAIIWMAGSGQVFYGTRPPSFQGGGITYDAAFRVIA